MNPQEPVKFASSQSTNPQAGSQADQENADNNVTEPDRNRSESKDLQSEEEYRTSERVSKPKDEMEDVNQEAEDPVCNHDVLRGNGV
jgi:hypothetical protein